MTFPSFRPHPLPAHLAHVIRVLSASALMLVATHDVFAQAETSPPQRIQLSGYIRHAESRELIRYALVGADGSTARSQSNVDGFYFLNLAPGAHRILVRAIGFAPLDTTITLTASTTADFLLVPRAVQLQAVEVNADKQRSDVDPKAPEMSIARLDLQTIRQAPAALGEVDPIRSLTLLPGVSRSSDFSTAFSVRGGTNDQNLILLDEATIYNPAHVLGFLSVFNADAVADVTLYKGAIPARFGGRLSSVLDARQREGNANEFTGTASIGLLASRLLVEGPIAGKRGSWLIAARRSYADLFLKIAPDTSVRDSRAYFYDLNAKTNFKLGKTGTLMASAYMGRDLFSPSADFEAGWGNLSGTLRWNHIFKNRLFSKVSVTTGTYDYLLGFTVLDGSVDWTSRILSKELRVDESYHFSERNVVEFGAELATQSMRPGDLEPADTTKLLPVRVSKRQGMSMALHASHVVDLGERVSLRYGVRYSAFARRAPGMTYQYEGGQPTRWNPALSRYESGIVVDSTLDTSGTIADFGGLEPRASLRFGLTPTSSLKASYARTRQYLLLATRTNSPTPLDVWEPVGPWIKPQVADQGALGYVTTLKDGAYEASAEVYYKRSYNVLDFVDGSDVILNPQIESALLQGIGRSYGLELFVRKQLGNVTGWVSYTLSRAETRFRAGPGAGINDGEWFAAPTDKTHDLSVIAVRPLWKRWTFGSTFTLATGLPTTYPVSRYVVDDYVVPEYGKRNANRLPMYHRLDLSLTRTGRRHELQFGVFNAYNRFNAQSMSFRQVEDDRSRTEAVQLSVFGIVPSISWTIRF
ncbi:MAG: TonB-dependent receptor [Cytophagaceae bacterium]|nr:TonB-dependent receptor [Gemmatimonadaceae bacterium]